MTIINLRLITKALLQEKGIFVNTDGTVSNRLILDAWVTKLMTLATRCCATVRPDVNDGKMDIRPYCKIKGEYLQECFRWF